MKLLIEERTLSDAIRAYTARGGQMASVYPTESEDNTLLRKAIKNNTITLDKNIYRGIDLSDNEWNNYFYRWYDGEKVPFKMHTFNSFSYDKTRTFGYGGWKDFHVTLVISKGTTVHAIDLQEDTIYPEEDEVLVGDVDKFYIKDIQFEGEGEVSYSPIVYLAL